MRPISIIAWSCCHVSVRAQEHVQRIGFELAASPSYVSPTDPDGSSAMNTGSPHALPLRWIGAHTGDGIALGGGLFFTGERKLFPLYLHVTVPPSNVCENCFLTEAYMQRVEFGIDAGVMLGSVPTSNGDLRVDQMHNADVRYRLGEGDSERRTILFHGRPCRVVHLLRPDGRRARARSIPQFDVTPDVPASSSASTHAFSAGGSLSRIR